MSHSVDLDRADSSVSAPRTLVVGLIALLLGAFSAASPSYAQTVTSGLVTTRESLEGVRYKSLANTGSR